MSRNYNGVVSTGYVVLFTDGGDSAGRLDAASAASVVSAARVTGGASTDLPTVQTFAVALEGADYDPEALQYLLGGTAEEPSSFVVEADSAAKLESTFTQIANRISGQVESTFLLAYCSSKRAGMATVTISVDPKVSPEANTLSFSFNSDGFGPGCNAEYFESACAGLQCGGFNCGACADSTSYCDQTTLQCVNYCLDDNLCSGEQITNPHGYQMTCSFGDNVMECGAQCVDTFTDPNNCGS